MTQEKQPPVFHASKASTVLRALELGLEVKLGDYTYVWLDNHPTQVIDDMQYGIDGLAIKCETYTVCKVEDAKPHYIGSDISLNSFVKMCDNLGMGELMALSASITLTEHNRKKR